MTATRRPVRPDLTEREQRCYAILLEHWKARKPMPTRKELAEAMEYSSNNAADQVLEQLERKGYVVLTRGRARAIEVRT